MLTPKKIHTDISAHHEQFIEILAKEPWLIPSLTALHLVPVVIGVKGFWKSSELRLKLKIEREKTKQAALQQMGSVHPGPKKACCPSPLAKFKASHHLPNPLRHH